MADSASASAPATIVDDARACAPPPMSADGPSSISPTPTSASTRTASLCPGNAARPCARRARRARLAAIPSASRAPDGKRCVMVVRTASVTSGGHPRYEARRHTAGRKRRRGGAVEAQTGLDSDKHTIGDPFGSRPPPCRSRPEREIDRHPAPARSPSARHLPLSTSAGEHAIAPDSLAGDRPRRLEWRFHAGARRAPASPRGPSP